MAELPAGCRCRQFEAAVWTCLMRGSVHGAPPQRVNGAARSLAAQQASDNDGDPQRAGERGAVRTVRPLTSSPPAANPPHPAERLSPQQITAIGSISHSGTRRSRALSEVVFSCCALLEPIAVICCGGGTAAGRLQVLVCTRTLRQVVRPLSCRGQARARAAAAAAQERPSRREDMEPRSRAS